ncbi:transmembrane emp24 domain-containing protein 6-like [Asterias rubens]|uniref:transmembrane emp24 domain-containing protein 6-like n=1 Tax=Asterias rubens TaxID=7604 RepID=UPI001455458C|nr:transmembrane emp24 domain-containing protein 6-like [Asterias rubens]
MTSIKTPAIYSNLLKFFLLSLFLECTVSEWVEPSRHAYVDPIDREQPWISFQLTFILERGTEQCFFQKVKTGFKFQLHYHASSRDVEHNMRVIIKTDRGERLYTSFNNIEDEFERDVDKDETYNLCFGNFASRYHAKKVSMTIDMFEENTLQKYFTLKAETEHNLANASDSIQRTWRQMFRVSRQQYMLRFSTELDTMLQSSNADYILYWSIAQATIIILAGFIQVWTLRSFFNVKTVTPTQKPRC